MSEQQSEQQQSPDLSREKDASMALLLDGFEKVAKDVTDKTKAMTDKVEQVAKDSKRGLDDLEAKTEKSMQDVVLRLERIGKSSSILGKALGMVTAGDDVIKGVLPQSVRERASTFEAFSRSMPRDSVLADATVAMAVSEWWRRSTRLQLPRHFGAYQREDAEIGDKLFQALQEKALGANWETIQKATMEEGTAAVGGNLVPTIVESDLIRQIKDAGRLFPLARQVQMTKKVHQVPSETTACSVNWIAESGSLTQGEPNVGQKTLTALKLAGRAKMSLELVEDSNVGLLAYLLEIFTEKMAGELDKQMVAGDASQPAITGIDNTSGILVVSSSATAAGRNLTWQLLVNTFCAAGEASAIDNGYWIVTPKGYAAIIGLADSTGQPIVRFGQAEGAPAGTLIGRPILLSARFGGTPSGVTSTLDDSTNANTKIIYGPPSSILFGVRQGMRWDVTDQVGWANYQMDARLVGRFAMVVGVPANFSRLSKVNTT